MQAQLAHHEQQLKEQEQQLQQLQQQELGPTSAQLRPSRGLTSATSASGAAVPMSNTNFAKMMSMQQEINQLKACIEGLTAGGGRGQLARRGRAPG